MPVVRATRPLLIHSVLAWLAIPLFILDLWVMRRGAEGRFPLASLFEGKWLAWIAAVSLVSILSSIWIVRAKRAGVLGVALLAAAAVLADAVLFLRTKNYALAFYALFVLILSVIYVFSAARLLGEAYFDSGRRWFEGLPRFLPRLQAEVRCASSSVVARVSRLDENGCFAFCAEPFRGVPESVCLAAGESTIESRVKWITRTGDGLGLGLRFVIDSQDSRKEIREFVDRARSVGYVD